MATTKTRKPTTKTEEQVSRETLVDRVRKLLALAARAGTPEEAATAAAKAAAIMVKYTIAESELGAGDREGYTRASLQPEGPIVHRCVMAFDQSLLGIVAEASFCKAILSRSARGQTDGDVIGQPHNIEIVRYLFHYLRREVDRMGNAAARAAQRESAECRLTGSIAEPILGPNAYLRHFRMGALAAIRDRLLAPREEAKQENESTMALIVLKDAELEEATGKLVPNLTTRRSHSAGIADYGAYSAGYVAGRDMPINPALGGK